MAILNRPRRRLRLVVLVIFLLTAVFLAWSNILADSPWRSHKPHGFVSSSYDWSKRRQKYPVANEFVRPPAGTPHELPRIQHKFERKGPLVQNTRRQEVLEAFTSCWDLYRNHAWGHDEIRPITLTGVDNFGGWGATLVDSLDALWILDLKPEFYEALHFVAKIDWNNVGDRADCSLFETNIRYLGGLLSAYDLSNETVLLRKAVELGDMLYNGFDTPLRMPANIFNFEAAKAGTLEASSKEPLAHVGSLSLEFTRLSQLTGDPKYFDAIERIKLKLVDTQERTKLPGLWPKHVDLANGFLVGSGDFTMGSLADSYYEYLPKMYMLLGGLDDSYKDMYIKAARVAKHYLLFRPALPDDSVDILFAGNGYSNGFHTDEYGDVRLVYAMESQVQHLGCFIGGMYALGARLFPDTPSEAHILRTRRTAAGETYDDMSIAGKLTRGCAWAYNIMPTHVMPEESVILHCTQNSLDHCEWDEDLWERQGNKRLPKGFASVHGKDYMLRPEAVESLFYMWRTTGEEVWRDMAWEMFVAIRRLTATAEGAFSAVRDVTRGESLLSDSMEVSLSALSWICRKHAVVLSDLLTTT